MQQCVCADLKVLVGQVDLQAQRVDALWERPRLQLGQREGVLTESGQHILHQDDLVTHLGLLQAVSRTRRDEIYDGSTYLNSSSCWMSVCEYVRLVFSALSAVFVQRYNQIILNN